MADIQLCQHHAPPPPSSGEATNLSNNIFDDYVEEEGSNNNYKEVEANEVDDNNIINYAQRAQWLRAALLGANDGLLSTASLMMGVGAVKKDAKTMIITGVAGLIGGACSMAIGELVSVYSQYDIELSQLKRDGINTEINTDKLPNPFQASLASAVSFAVGAVVPLLGAAFVKEYKVRLGVVVGVVSLALIVFGGLGAVLGKAPLVKSCLRVLIGGWLAMALTFGLTKFVDSIGG